MLEEKEEVMSPVSLDLTNEAEFTTGSEKQLGPPALRRAPLPSVALIFLQEPPPSWAPSHLWLTELADEVGPNHIPLTPHTTISLGFSRADLILNLLSHSLNVIYLPMCSSLGLKT